MTDFEQHVDRKHQMNTHQAIISNLQTSRFVMNSYVGDLSDADLLARPVAGANHAAWQLGHLILSECQMMRGVFSGWDVTIPHDFAAKHDKTAAVHDTPAAFYPKQTYVELMNRVREATLAVLPRFSQSDLSNPGPEAMRSYAPTVGSVFLAIGNHELLHAGQIAVLRRALGKPIVM